MAVNLLNLPNFRTTKVIEPQRDFIKLKTEEFMSPALFDQSDNPPTLVLWAVGLLALLFLGGLSYLLVHGVTSGVTVEGLVDVPGRMTALAEYQGPLWGLDRARQAVNAALQRSGLETGEAITEFPGSPAHMRLVAVDCRVGYVVPMRAAEAKLPAGIVAEKVTPQTRLVVRVLGGGDNTGFKAYRIAAGYLKKQGLRPGDGVRYEVKERQGKIETVVHWLPVGKQDGRDRLPGRMSPGTMGD
jgi:hypothetical protein